jgi:indole-3-glycerol phosphate synthase
MSEDFLDTMARASRARVDAARAAEPEASLFRRAFATPDPPRLTLSPQGFDLIAEVKLRSPAVGLLRGGGENLDARVSDYAEAGAAAVSVLTEPTRFDGSLEHLVLAAQALATQGGVPAMRKDFLVDPYQAAEARLAGAGGILIILRMLSRGETEALLEAAARLKLFVLAETFDEADIAIAHELVRSPVARDLDLLVGLNSRDLVTLKVVPGRLEALVERLPGTVPRVAESGVATAADAARLAEAGYDLALVGSALMTSADPPALLADMLREGRAARAG